MRIPFRKQPAPPPAQIQPEDILSATRDFDAAPTRTTRDRVLHGFAILAIGIASCVFVFVLIVGIQRQEQALAVLKQLWETGVSIVVPQRPPPPPGGPILVPTVPPNSTPRPLQQPSAPPAITPLPQPSGPLPSDAPDLVTVPDGMFGSSATVIRFPVTGSDPEAIRASALEYGIPLFAGDGAISWVVPVMTENITWPGESGPGCAVQVPAAGALAMRYEIHLPSWTPTTTDAATVQWWNETFTEALLHERSHVDLYEHYVTQINAEISDGAPCETARETYTRLMNEMNGAQCEFDIAELGLAPGATLEDCQAFRGS